MKRVLAMLVVFLILAAVGVSKPSLQRHNDAIAASFRSNNEIMGKLGGGELLTSFTEYHDYIYFSTVSLKGRRLSTGFLGRVRVAPISAGEAADLLLSSQ